MTPQHAPMKTEYLNQFCLAAVNVFRTMVGCELKRQPLRLRDQRQTRHEISGVIGLSGKARGTVVLELDREVALRATEAMTGEAPTGLDADVIDVVGELTNMVAGHAKSKLEQLAMSITLPSVVTGPNHCVSFPQGVTVIGIPFTCDWGALCVEIGLVERGEG